MMRYGSIPGISKPVFCLIQGAVMISSRNPDASFALLDAVFALGCNAFDTALVYGNGDSERTLGKWVNDRAIRDKVVIITKGAHPSDRNRVTPADITSDIARSLENLRTDCIDLYLLHRDDPSVPVGPTLESLNEHRAAGRIRAFGGSNWSHQRLAEAADYARSHRLVPFAVSSPNFSLAEQVKPPWAGCVSLTGPGAAPALAWYAQSQTPLLAWSSLAGGFFSGRFRPDNLDQFQDYLDKLCVSSYCTPENFTRLDRARTLASEKGLSPAQVALAFVLSQPMNLFALTGCRSGDEFAQNLSALDVKLDAAQLDWLDLKTDVC